MEATQSLQIFEDMTWLKTSSPLPGCDKSRHYNVCFESKEEAIHKGEDGRRTTESVMRRKGLKCFIVA